ncbi:hypothetical protein XM25_12970 [Devosia sp. H5989]|nr:hypothetical protein XM25_12970 [Devosia sp. H5989]
MMPQRMVLSRRRGFDLQAESARINGLQAQVVGRPSRWGNPFSVPDIQARFGLDAASARAKAVELHRQWLEGTIEPALSPGEAPTPDAVRADLAGKNLACWCSLDGPCHADTLLRIANL